MRSEMEIEKQKLDKNRTKIPKNMGNQGDFIKKRENIRKIDKNLIKSWTKNHHSSSIFDRKLLLLLQNNSQLTQKHKNWKKSEKNEDENFQKSGKKSSKIKKNGHNFRHLVPKTP